MNQPKALKTFSVSPLRVSSAAAASAADFLLVSTVLARQEPLPLVGLFVLPKALQPHGQGFRVSGFRRWAEDYTGAGEGRQEAWAAPASVLSPALLLPALSQWSVLQ